MIYGIPEIPCSKVLRHRFGELVIGVDRTDNNINRLENLKDAYIISNAANCKAISIYRSFQNRLAPLSGIATTG